MKMKIPCMKMCTALIPMRFSGAKILCWGEISIFLHGDIIFIHENEIFKHENRRFPCMKIKCSCMTFSCHDLFMHETFYTGILHPRQLSVVVFFRSYPVSKYNPRSNQLTYHFRVLDGSQGLCLKEIPCAMVSILDYLIPSSNASVVRRAFLFISLRWILYF